ncbi:MAG TPA: amino acid adenylation domain-containing protein [Thermoanaerobaculia bacterium]|nr:amino acid adenylation domain-containing protein [Thermoanaerobaculia bacterium]
MTFESVQDLFSRAAAQHGSRTAIDRAGIGITYRDLEARSNQLANVLLAGGAARGSVVAILADDRIAVVTAMLAVLKAGCAFAPLDPNAPPKRLAAMVAEADPAWFLAEARLLPMLGGVEGARVVGLDDAKGGDASHPGLAAGPDDMAYLYFTSGSTGRPKGIAGRLQGIDHFIRWEIETLGIAPGARVSQLTTPSFDAFLRDVFVPLCAGGTVCVPESREVVLDAPRLIDWLDLEEIELVHCVPSLFRSILNGALSPGYFAAMKHVLLAGEPLLPADVGRWLDVFGERIRLVNLYGPSETTMTKLFYFVTAADRERKSMPIGKPMPGAQALVVGANGKAAPPGTIGEILIRTPYRSLGYYRQPELTAEAFVQNPFNPAPGDVVYRTGDLGRLLKDGNFEFLGRRDSQVKIRGVRVEIAEVENQLRSHPAVRDVAVVDRDNAAGGKSLCAYVVLGEETDANALREALLSTLPEAFVPDWFVPLDELPRTLTGKVDRKALPAPDSARLQDAAFTAPRSLTEELLAGIWCELLELKQVGIHQSFFAVGGHSLLATQLLSRIRSTFEIELPLNRLFEAPTIAGLAEGVEAARRAGELSQAPPIERTPREGRLPLSYAQRSLWLTDRMEPGNAAYNIANAHVLTGPLNISALRSALGEVIRRHEALRTTFPTAEGEPVQRIAPAGPAGPAGLLPVIDLGALPADLRAAEQRRLSAAAALRPFRLDRDPLLRASLVRTGGEEHTLLLTVHHIVSDAWSATLLVREWTTLYAAALEGKPSPLPELPIQYADFASWQARWLRGEVRESLLAYWRGQLAGSPAALDMPTDRPRPAVQTYRGAAESLRLPRALKESLEGLSRGASSTLFMTLFAAYAALLSRRSGQTEVVIGTPTAGRSRTELENLIGFFANPIALRVDLGGEPSFNELLVRVRRTVLGALSHQDLPFELLVEELRPVRDRSRAPVFQTSFQLQNVPSAKTPAAGLELKSFGRPAEVVKLDFNLDLGNVGDGLGGALEYRIDLFDRSTAERLLRHFQLLLETVAAAPDRPLREIELITAEERGQLLAWGTNPGARPADTVLDVLAAHAAGRPDAPAVVFGEETLTYAELESRANQLARHLTGLGVGPEVLAGLAMERSAAMVVGLLGILKAGAAYLPLDPSYPPERLALMLDDARPAVLITEDQVIGALPKHRGLTVNLDADEAFIGLQSGEPLATGISPDNSAYVIFTSGSTGEPKGVRLTHRGLRNLAEAQRRTFGVTPDDRVLQFASLSFDASIFEIAMALCAGATLHMAPRKEMMPGPGFVQLLRERGITNATLPPSVLAMLPPEELPALETVIVAGEACPAELVARWAPGRRFWNAYGPTETTVWASTALCTGGERKPTIGHPVPNAEIHILDRDLRPVPAGVPGVLHIGGLGLAAGYLNRPALTAERFIPHPFAAEPGARLYDTGDLARWLADGQIDFLGRVDHQVKLRAFRIEPGEIEAVLGRHSTVREAVVLLRGEAPGQRLVAYLVCEQPNPAVAELRGLLARHLPEYMMPAAFVFLDALPLRPNGKIDRDALPDPGQVKTAGQGRVAPRNPVEEALAGLWEEVLGAGRIGVEDDFFELGGYSLAATQVLNRVHGLFGVELDFDTFFQTPTVAAVAAAIARALEEGEARRMPPLEPVPRHGDLPLSFPQELLWRDEQRTPGLPGAHVTSAVRLSGALDREALARSLDEIVRRHEALRTVFPVVDGVPRQRIEPAGPLALRTADLRHLSPAARAEAAGNEMEREVRQPFDLAAGPLARGLLLQEDEEEHVLLLVCHHIVIDLWSAGIFTRELAALYQAFSQAQPSPLPELPLQYGDYAVWQRQWLQGDALESQLAYWRGQLAGAAPLALPTDRPRGDRLRGPSAGSLLTLSWDLAEALHALSRQQGATLFMTLLAAFELLLHAETGQDDVLVDFPIANRRRREIEPLIGFFPNRLLLRTDLGGSPSYLELLRRVQKVTLDAYTHQDLPYEVLLEETGLARDLLRVSCNFYNAPSDPLVLEGLELTPLNVRDKVMDVDLFFLLQEREDGLACGFFYRTDLFEPATVRRIERRFHALLEAIVRDPSQSLPELVRAMDRTSGSAVAAEPELLPVSHQG